MSYDYFLECINKLKRLDEDSYDFLTKKFKEHTNSYFDKYIDSLEQDEYLKNMPKFEYYLNINAIHTKINEKYLDPNILAYYNDVSKYYLLSSDEESIILKKIYKLKTIISKRKINNNYLNKGLYYYGYNKKIKEDILSRRMQLKYLKRIKDKDFELEKYIRKFKLYVYYIDLKEKFINCNLRLVVSYLKRKKIKMCDVLDFIQWGNDGLLCALENYKPKYNTKFSTYAYFWINCKINRGLFKERKTVKSSYGIYLLSRQYNNFSQNYYSSYGIYPTLDEKIRFIYDRVYSKKNDGDIEKYKDKCLEKIKLIEKIINYENSISIDIQIGENYDNSIVDMLEDPRINVEKEATDFESRDIIKDILFNVINITNKQLCIILLRNGISIQNYLSFADFQSVFPNLSFDIQKEIWKSQRIYTLEEIGCLFNVSKQSINVQELKIKEKIKKYKNIFNDYFDI